MNYEILTEIFLTSPNEISNKVLRDIETTFLMLFIYRREEMPKVALYKENTLMLTRDLPIMEDHW